jgi:hypothetical protein
MYLPIKFQTLPSVYLHMKLFYNISMFKTQTTCVYIYVITKFVITKNDGQVVKDLPYGHGGEGSNPIFDI